MLSCRTPERAWTRAVQHVERLVHGGVAMMYACRLLMAQHSIENPAPPHMWSRPAQVIQQTGIRAAGILKSISEDRGRDEVARSHDQQGNPPSIGFAPVGIEGDWAEERIAEDVAEQIRLSDPLLGGPGSVFG
jgi:hypothetical protein